MIMNGRKTKYISPNLSENLFNDGLNFFNLYLSFILQGGCTQGTLLQWGKKSHCKDMEHL